MAGALACGGYGNALHWPATASAMLRLQLHANALSENLKDAGMAKQTSRFGHQVLAYHRFARPISPVIDCELSSLEDGGVNVGFGTNDKSHSNR
jgi:hypothetical protein